MWVESDPRPAYCSACHDSTAGRYFTNNAMFDAGAFQDKETLAYVAGSDELNLCDVCARGIAEAAALKPELHARQYREIERQRLEIEHWRAYARRLEATLVDRPEPAPSARRKPGRPRKVAA